MSKSPAAQSSRQSRGTLTRRSGSTLGDNRSGDLEDARNSILGDVKKIPVASLGKLLDSLFPLVNECIIDSVVDHLRTSDKLHGSCFSLFNTAPTDLVDKEADIFRPLEALYSEIMSFPMAHSQSMEISRLVVAINTAGRSSWGSTSQPCGHILTISQGSDMMSPLWSDILVPFEFKKTKSDSLGNDDMDKIMWSMYHMMRRDRFRRFALGVTIGNARGHLLYCDRSGWHASESFDLINDSSRVIHLFLPSGLGSLESLGLGHIIRGILSSSPNLDEQFEIDVQCPHLQADHEFPPEAAKFMVGLISDSRADVVRGRGTRVWKVVWKSDPHRKVYALKDVWFNPTCSQERMVLDSVLHRLGPPMKEIFLTVYKAGDVVLSMWGIGYCADSTLKSHRWQEDGPLIASKYIYGFCTSRFKFGTGKDSDSIGHPPFISTIGDRIPVPPGAKELLNHDQRHYRIVFEEIEIPLHSLETRVEIFTALKGAVQTSESLKNIGYVHRDVSSGSILLVKRHQKAPVGGLMDLGYAKPIGDPSTHKFRTGTKDFLAHEVAVQRYTFLPIIRQPNRSLRPTFNHNYLHDLESAWWVAIWASTHLIPVGDKWSDSAIRNYLTLFPPRWESMANARSSAFRSDQLEELMDEIPSNAAVLSELILWGNQLLGSYTAYEANYPSLDATAFAEVHQQGLGCLDATIPIVDNRPLQRMPNTRGLRNQSGS